MVPVRPEAAVAVTKPSTLSQLPDPSPLMKRLGAPLLALPAYQTGTALADAPPAFTEVGLRYTHYSEDSIDQDLVIYGATDRYDIDVTQLWIEAPFGASWSVALDVQSDYQTGASPWFVGAQQDGEPGVIMSGASIQDNRVEVGVTTRYFWTDGNAGFAISHSDEDDYEATALTFDASWNTAGDARTWSTSLSSSSDKLNPTKEVIPVFITEEDVDTQSGYFGVSQILSRTAIARIGFSYTLSKGYLSDPYKLRDQRPDNHERLSLSAGYRRFLPDADASLQIDYRYYADSWGIDSHTVELAWAQNLPGSLLTPYMRYYTQREADFFSVIADTESQYYADDYRLSSYGAVTLGARWAVAVGESWTLELEAEHYMTHGDWGVFDGDAAPALVDFWRGTVGIIWRFD